MADFMKMLKVALGVTIVSFILTWIYSKFVPAKGLVTISFAVVDVNVGNQIRSGIDTTLAGKLLGSLIGSVPVGVQTFVLIFVASLIVIGIGSWLNRQLGGPYGKTENTRFAFDLTFGTIAVGLLVGWMNKAGNPLSIGAVGTALALFIYFIIVAGVYALLRNWGMKDFLPTPQ